MHRTITARARGEYKEKGSKFIGILVPAATRQAVDRILSDYREHYADATHVCYAYRLRTEERAADAGEPRGSAGPPILRQLQSAGLIHVMAFVLRYYGGTKLGVPGLIRAYGEATAAAIEAADLVPFVPVTTIEIRYPYDATAQVERVLNQTGAQVKAHEYTADCRLLLKVPESEVEAFRKSLQPYVTSFNDEQ